MSQEYPSLVLDDLVHIMSPSPAPQTLQDDSDLPPRIRSTSPLPESDIIQMRRKVAEIRSTVKTDTQLTPREKELVEMVLKLTAVVRPDSDQLSRQADMISALIQQRDLLLHQAEEQRLLWNSEKDGWARMAEALLAQQAKKRSNSERDEDLEHLHATEADNKGIRQRLNESQSRLQTLESELTRLRPLLLMQPLISRSSIPPTPQPKNHTRRRKKDAAATEDEDHVASEDDPLVDPFGTPSQSSQSQVTPRIKSRKSEAHNPVPPFAIPHVRRPSQKAVSRGLSADARVEHLLLAARKIGKHRAGIVSGMVQRLGEKERERRREESATTVVGSTPKTPKRNMLHSAYAPEGGYVYLNAPMQPRPGMQPVPLFIPAYPHHILQTPSSSTTAPSASSSAQKTKQGTGTNNPPTPLDSLLNAARSMMREDVDAEGDEDEEVDVVGDSPGAAAGTRHTRSRDLLGSPVPKRRRVTARTDKLATSHDSTSRATNDLPASSVDTVAVTNVGAGRVRSALDVLADQAAAFSTQEPSAIPSQTQTQTQAKGKGKERGLTQPQEHSSSTPKSRGRTSSGQEPDVDARSSVIPASRSRTPQSDLGDNPADSTRSTRPQADGSSSEALVDPGGETSGATSDPSSSQTFDATLASDSTLVTANSDAHSPPLQDTPSMHADESGDATPRQGSRAQAMHREAEPSSTHDVENEHHEASSPLQAPEIMPSGDQNSEISGSGLTWSVLPAKNKEIIRVAGQDMPAPGQPTKRQRSPYVKWSKEEDDLLAQAVAKYGQKWDLVQKALPSRGYHQVRQRWLRKLGVFDSKPDLSSYQTAVSTFPSTSRGGSVEPRGNPKLGLAPLSSERMISGIVGRPPSMP